MSCSPSLGSIMFISEDLAVTISVEPIPLGKNTWQPSVLSIDTVGTFSLTCRNTNKTYKQIKTSVNTFTYSNRHEEGYVPHNTILSYDKRSGLVFFLCVLYVRMLCSVNKSKKVNTASLSLQGGCTGRVQSDFWAFTSCTGHRRWRKTKEPKPWNNTKQSFPWTENKEVLFYIIFVQFIKFWPTFGITFVELMKKQQ